MNPKEQRIAIAEACGWTEISPRIPWGIPLGIEDDGTEHCLKHLPDYLNDLNAMHEAVATLSGFDLKIYAQELMNVCREYPVGSFSDYRADLISLAKITQATAAQRAESLLRTIGKWEDES